MPFSFVRRPVECVAHQPCASMMLGMLIKWLTLCLMLSTLLERHSYIGIDYVLLEFQL